MNIKSINILNFPGGSEIALEIRDALSYEKKIKIFGASGDKFDPGQFLYKKYDDSVPHIRFEDVCIEKLNSLIEKWKIDYIFPCHDDAIVFLAKNKNRLNCKVLAPDFQTCLQLRSKSKTISALKDFIPTPKTFTYSEIEYGNPNAQYFVKPDQGQGSFDTHLIAGKDISRFRETSESYVFSEFLPGHEYTIDCLSSKDNSLLASYPRIRNKMKAGIAVHTQSITDPSFITFAEIISKKLKLSGAWFFQMKRDNKNELKLLEIAPRIAGTMAFNRILGVNYPLLSIYIQENIPVKIEPNIMPELKLSRSFRNHYKSSLKFERAFVDLDDTLIINDYVNTKLVSLIHQWIDNGIPVILITRCKENLDLRLTKFRIKELFDEIIHLHHDEPKSDYMTSSDIFVDDSFYERQEVYNKLRIPTFDLSMIDCLVDERM